MFAVQFHKRAYADRVKKSKAAHEMLATLNKARTRQNRTKSGVSTARDSPVLQQPEQQQGLDEPSSGANTNAPNSTSKMNAMGKGIKSRARGVSKGIITGLGQAVGAAIGLDFGDSGSLVLRTEADANLFPKKLFQALVDDDQEFLFPSNFEPYFHHVDELRQAFAIFDRDGNGDISKKEMKSAIIEIHRERVVIIRVY